MRPRPLPLILASCAALMAQPRLQCQQPNEAKLAQAVNDFSLDLYKRIARGGDNLCLSPASISTALLMAHAGARGKTEAQMETVLYLARHEEGKEGREEEAPAHLEGKALRSAVAAMLEKLNPPARKAEGPIQEATKRRQRFFGTPAELRVVNAMWGQEGYPFSAGYVGTLENSYGALVQFVDFTQNRAAAREAINAWVTRETKGKIKNLISPGVLQPLTRLVLTNAVYFKGSWSDEFKKRATEPARFHLEGADPIMVPTMHQTEHHGYFEDDRVQVLQMGYRGGLHAMVILLPKRGEKGATLAAFEKTLTPVRLRELTSQLKSVSVRVALPKFKITSTVSLNEHLSALGMGLAFDPDRADFSGINDGQEQIWISHVLHKTYIDVDEEGTEAAAATAMAFMGKAALPGKPISFQADRPFVFLLRDVRTGLVLFMGRVIDPRG